VESGPCVLPLCIQEIFHSATGLGVNRRYGGFVLWVFGSEAWGTPPGQTGGVYRIWARECPQYSKGRRLGAVLLDIAPDHPINSRLLFCDTISFSLSFLHEPLVPLFSRFDLSLTSHGCLHTVERFAATIASSVTGVSALGGKRTLGAAAQADFSVEIRTNTRQ